MPFHEFKDAEGTIHKLGGKLGRHGTKNGGRLFSLPLSEIKDGGIDAGLILLTYWCNEHPGVTLTRDQIAFVCGCSDSFIYALQERALRKLNKFHARKLRALLEAAS